MRRALLLLLALSGCAPYVEMAGATVLAAGPGMIGLGAAKQGQGDGYMEMNYVDVRGDDQAAGGWGVGMRSAGILGKPDSLQTFYLQGNAEAGKFGRDGIYGFSGITLGTGVRLREKVAIVGALGYRWGGYPQTGHTFPARAAIYAAAGKFVFHGGVYAGWRVGERDEWPEAESFGPGWSTWGGDASILFGTGNGGLAVGVGYDREDNIDIVTIHVGAAMHPIGDQ